MVKVKTNKQQSNMWLWILLGGLVVAIVILIVVVAVVRINGPEAFGGLSGGGEEGSQEGGEEVGEFVVGPEGLVGGSEGMGDEEALQVAADAQTLISDRFNATGNVDEANDLYQQAVDEAKDENKQLAAVLLMVDKMEFLAYQKHCDEAIEYINSLDLSDINNDQKRKIYIGGSGVGIYCDDTEEATKWSNAINNLGN